MYDTEDLVFAKVKGHSPWPATVISQEPGSKYRVVFFGTNQEATVKEDFVRPYKENKSKMELKYRSKKYKTALEIIEKVECRGNNSEDLEIKEALDEADELNSTMEGNRYQQNPFYDESAASKVLETNGFTYQEEEVTPPSPVVKTAPAPSQPSVSSGPPAEVSLYQPQALEGQLVPANVPTASSNSQVDHNKIKVKIQIEIEMSSEQLISVGQGLPGFLNAANVQVS